MKRAGWMPDNCPVVERTGDGRSAGRCWYYLRDGKCPRHGNVDELPEDSERPPTTTPKPESPR